MQTVQESLQAEYDELYEHYQVGIPTSSCCHAKLLFFVFCVLLLFERSISYILQ